LEAVEEFGLNRCVIKGRAGTKTPQRQAYEAADALVKFLAPITRRRPYLVSTVCWPHVSRQ
jgi:hypothetical protein